ncbi:MAG: hypothetical protein P8L77_01645 [Gammaproteobacteria bacterium]|nr:hypothetical protein [Gammaproteobacteria bacterium]
MIYKILLTLFCTCVFAMIPESDIARLNKDIFSADESNYDDLKVYFTDDAWLRFSTALLRSGNLSSLTKNKMRTNVAFLGILEAKKIDDKQIIKSKILVTYQNKKVYQTSEYITTMQFVDQEPYYKIALLTVDPVGLPTKGQMAPECPLK